MKTNKFRLLLAVIAVVIAASSCSVEYRARHPRPRHKKVIVVGKADANEKINDTKEAQHPDQATVAVY